MADMEEVWRRITSQADQQFTQKRGATITYAIKSGCLKPDRTNRQIPRSDFAKALQFVPLADTRAVQHLQGPSYIYAVLMDRRIRQDDW